jgi:PAT family beta-lactamase induction signal transducer AmpG
MGKSDLNLPIRQSTLNVIFSRRMLVAFLMGFSGGLPLLLTWGVLQAWMTEKGVDLTWIGMISLVQIPYTWKFLWAPFLDRFIPPFLGRRRGWLLMSQIALMASIVGLGYSDPVNNIWLMIVAAILVAFFSATQDIVIDAYRREDLSDEELGLGSSMYVYGYRLGMLLASGGGLILADLLSFPQVYFLMSLCMLPGILTTLMTPEPKVVVGTPQTMKEAMVDPFVDYFSRHGAVWILVFILLYKIGDTMASGITMPFYLETGFSKTEIGTVVKFFGTGATLIGAFVGGVLLLKIGINRGLWVFGILQALSTAGFAILARIGYNIAMLSGVIAFENLSSGMGTAAFVAFMASITNKKFTATQYALLTGIMGLSRQLASSVTGFMAKNIGWENFFIFCTLVAIPGILLLLKIAPWNAQPAEEDRTV